MTANGFDPKSSANDHITIIRKAILECIMVLIDDASIIRTDRLKKQASQVASECKRLQKLVPNLSWLPNSIRMFTDYENLSFPIDLSKILDAYSDAKTTIFTDDGVGFNDLAFNFDALFRRYYVQDKFDQIFTDIIASFERMLSPDFDINLTRKNKIDIQTLVDVLKARNSPSIGVVRNFLSAVRTFIGAVFPDIGIALAGIEVVKNLLKLVEEGENRLSSISEKMHDEFGEHFHNLKFVESYKKVLSYSPKGEIIFPQEPPKIDAMR